MTERCRCPASWEIDDNGACFIIRDHNGQALAYIYYEEESGRRSAANFLTRDEARRSAINIAKLPDALINKLAEQDTATTKIKGARGRCSGGRSIRFCYIC